MKIETEPREDHQVRIVAEIETDQYEQFKRRAARKIAQTKRIPGFRPGKAPYDVVRRFAGEEAIEHEALDLLVDDVYPQVLKEANVEPGAPGQLDEIISTQPVKLAFLVPLAPEVDLGPYHDVRLEYQAPEVTEFQVDEFLERLRSAYSTAEPVERPAQVGDMIFINLDARFVNPEEGQEAALFDNRPLQVEVKAGEIQDNDEWPFPGFSTELAGLSASDEKSIRHTFEEDSKYENLRGKEIVYTVRVESVKLMNRPELNDEFAQTAGDFQDMAALRANIRTGLENSAREEYEQDYYTHLLDKVGEGATVKYPPQMLDDETDSMLRSLERDLAQQKMDLETYLKVRNLDREKFMEDEVRPASQRRLKRSLLIDEVAKQEKIELSEKDLESSVSQTMAELRYSGDFDKLRKRVGNQQLATAVTMEAANRLMNRRVLERLKAIARGEPESPTQIEAMENEGGGAASVTGSGAAADEAKKESPEVAPETKAAKPRKPRTKKSTKQPEAENEEQPAQESNNQ